MKKLGGGAAYLLAGMMVLSAFSPAVRSNAQASSSSVQDNEVTQFMDCFEPMPIIEGLTEDCWGADEVGPRDQGNGLEDRDLSDYCYWDGAIIKNPDPAGEHKYYMFASRWNQAGGHWGQDGISGWQGSQAVYAVSDNLYGPYQDMGPLWPDWCEGAGHNVFPFALSEKDPLYAEGYRYAISISDTGMHGDEANGTLHISKSLDGPWTLIENDNAGKLKVDTSRFGLSNVSIAVGPDGRYIATNRNGDIARADSVAGEWEVQSTQLWWNVPGMSSVNVEDPVIWYSDGLYHIVVNKWDARMAYYLTSEDGVTWYKHPGTAYTPGAGFLRYEDGTVNDWTKLERPNIYVEDGRIKAMTFAVIDVQKEQDFGNDDHGSKIIVVPFSSEKLQQLDSAPNPLEDREGLMPVEDTTIQSWQAEEGKNYGAENHLQLQRGADTSTGLFGEGKKPYNDYDCKIALVKYDISDLLGEGKSVDSAEVSVVYTSQAAGNTESDQIQITLADSDWKEGNGKESGDGANGNHADEGTVTWLNQPELYYDEADTDNTTAISESFRTSDMNRVVNIDVTKLVRSYLQENPDAEEISFALSETAGNGNRLWIGSKEAGEMYAPRLILNTKDGGIPVMGIDLDKDSLEVEVGKSASLSVSVSPENAENKNVTWSSSDPEIAEVDENGIVTGIASGTAVITVTSEDGGYRAECTVKVTDPSETVVLPTADTSVKSVFDDWAVSYADDTVITMQKDRNFNQTWKDSAGQLGEWRAENGSRPDEWYNTSIAYVNYTLPEAGDTQELDSAKLILTYKGGSSSASKTQVQAVLADSDAWGGGTFTWKEMPELLYDPDNMEETIADSEVFASTEAGRTVEIDVTKLVNKYLQDNPQGSSLTFALNVTTVDTAYEFGSLEAGDDSVAQLKLRYKDTAVPVTGISLNKSELSMEPGDSAELTAVVEPEDAANKDVVWHSEDTTVAEVKDGVVTAKNPGGTVITVTTVDGQFTASCNVTVTEKSSSGSQTDPQEPDKKPDTDQGKDPGSDKDPGKDAGSDKDAGKDTGKDPAGESTSAGSVSEKTTAAVQTGDTVNIMPAAAVMLISLCTAAAMVYKRRK